MHQLTIFNLFQTFFVVNNEPSLTQRAFLIWGTDSAVFATSNTLTLCVLVVTRVAESACTHWLTIVTTVNAFHARLRTILGPDQHVTLAASITCWITRARFAVWQAVLTWCVGEHQWLFARSAWGKVGRLAGWAVWASAFNAVSIKEDETLKACETSKNRIWNVSTGLTSIGARSTHWKQGGIRYSRISFLTSNARNQRSGTTNQTTSWA